MSDRARANVLNSEAQQLHDAGDLEAAERRYRDAAAADPDWTVPWYNLGLLCKYERRWAESLDFNRRAADLGPDNEAAWWNLGIAATALGDWSTAREAWARCGLTAPEGDGAPDYALGQTPVRLDPHGDAEVVWAQRLDPARARILSIPLPWSPFNYGDVVLHDGAPEGYRVVDGREYPVFDVMERLEVSPLLKFVLELGTSDDAAIEALESTAEAMGGAGEHWGRSVRLLCRKCSRGTPHEHAGEGETPHPACGLAARDAAHAEAILSAWMSEAPRGDLVEWWQAG